MPETSGLSSYLKPLVGLVEKGETLRFNTDVMRKLSFREVGEVESHLSGLPSSPAIKDTLEAIKNARLGDYGPFAGKLPHIPIMTEIIQMAATANLTDAHLAEQKRVEIVKKYIDTMNALAKDNGATMQEGLKRIKHTHLACGQVEYAKRIENLATIVEQHTGVKAVVESSVVKSLGEHHVSVSEPHYSYSSSSVSTSATAKVEESWIGRLSKEKWVGKKGLVVAGATVGVGAVIYGAKKLLGRDKPLDNQQTR